MLKDVLKQARLEIGLTQEKVASQVKVAKQTYLKWENGETEPKATQIKLLAKTLKVSPNEICYGKKNKQFSFDEFVLKLARSSAPQELITMVSWEHIEDVEAFLFQLECYMQTKDAPFEAMAVVETVERNFHHENYDEKS
ncbi:RstR1 [Vibrio crassostreae]|uniref:helix-turn-helix transcriptional regulator n=1 Tax=Vibrio splendidus TaxID=29497 RepID=UPI002468458C|nr:helix-turn-helix transcriptional regulator [Vibrio splendidus]CAK3011626.1 RstR1 [Vibrio crassostreae]MDH5939728.1 helix-turn-helix domain-containing protein [Vibrio splendidus]MDH5939733.1 helix-turn-helix domain-containing protein [Vibrio splendidus]CAK3012202.1 RstR1 [Vibrio crassostreae]CAK3018206.1 RstR1 [Vibrio crassostreae]